MDLSRHCQFLLDLLAQRGPMMKQDLERVFVQLGRGTSSRMQQALRLLVNSGDVLGGESLPVYNVAPATLIEIDRHSGTYVLLGHPGAVGLLRFLGQVTGPDARGVRRFVSAKPAGDLEKELADFGISVRRAADESD